MRTRIRSALRLIGYGALEVAVIFITLVVCVRLGSLFAQDEPGDTVRKGARRFHLHAFRQPARHAVQRLIGIAIRDFASLPFEEANQLLAEFLVAVCRARRVGVERG